MGTKQNIYRILRWLFVVCENEKKQDYILKKLKLSDMNIAKYVCYEKTDKNMSKTLSILEILLNQSKLVNLKKLISIIGDSHYAFIQTVSKLNNFNMNALEFAIWNHNKSLSKYLINIDDIVALYDPEMNNKETELSIFRIIFIVFINCDENLMDHVSKALCFSNKTIVKFLNYSYPELTQKIDEKAPKFHEFDAYYLFDLLL